MDTITAEIKVNSGVGRKIVGILNSYPKYVTISNPLPASADKAITLEAMDNECMDLLSSLYNTDMRALRKKMK